MSSFNRKKKNLFSTVFTQDYSENPQEQLLLSHKEWQTKRDRKTRIVIILDHMNLYIYGCTVLVGRTEGKRLPGTPMHRLRDNIKMCLKQIGWMVMDWIHCARNTDKWWALENTIINDEVQLDEKTFLYKLRTYWPLTKKKLCCMELVMGLQTCFSSQCVFVTGLALKLWPRTTQYSFIQQVLAVSALWILILW